MTGMDLSKLAERWKTTYSGTEPIGEELKNWYKDRWARFDMLDNSKRYPDTSQDYRELLKRHNTLLNYLDPGDRILAITACWGDTPRPSTEAKLQLPSEFRQNYWLTVANGSDDKDADGEGFRYLYINKFLWKPGNLDKLLTLISNDELSGVIIAPINLAWLYHPYDGGADVILRSPLDRDRIRESFSFWSDR